MKFDKKDKDNTELTVKTGKKIIITLIFVIILLLISAVVVGIYNSEKQDKSDINNSTIADNETESKTEDKKENEEIADIEEKKTITEEERRYYEQAKPYIDTILNDFNILNELAKQQNRDETWKAKMSELAQKFIEDGLTLENLSNNKGVRPLSDLAGLFGLSIKFAGENLSDWLSGGNQEDYEDWEMCVNDANCYLQELNFYYITGVILQEQLEKDIKVQVGEESVDSINIMSGNNILRICIKQDDMKDIESTKNLAYMKIYDLLKMMSSKSYYDYLHIFIAVEDTIQVGKFIQVEFNPETRKNIDFDNLSWSEIPNIADNYIDRI